MSQIRATGASTKLAGGPLAPFEPAPEELTRDALGAGGRAPLPSSGSKDPARTRRRVAPSDWRSRRIWAGAESHRRLCRERQQDVVPARKGRGKARTPGTATRLTHLRQHLSEWRSVCSHRVWRWRDLLRSKAGAQHLHERRRRRTRRRILALVSKNLDGFGRVDVWPRDGRRRLQARTLAHSRSVRRPSSDPLGPYRPPQRNRSATARRPPPRPSHARRLAGGRLRAYGPSWPVGATGRTRPAATRRTA